MGDTNKEHHMMDDMLRRIEEWRSANGGEWLILPTVVRVSAKGVLALAYATLPPGVVDRRVEGIPPWLVVVGTPESPATPADLIAAALDLWKRLAEATPA